MKPPSGVAAAPSGEIPTGTVATTALVAVLMTETLLPERALAFVTYANGTGVALATAGAETRPATQIRSKAARRWPARRNRLQRLARVMLSPSLSLSG